MAKFTKRPDGRKEDELRPIDARAGVIKRADGSGYFKIGKTVAYAAVYGPRELHPRFMQNPKTGILRCYYGMLPFSGSGNRVRPGFSRRSQEINHVTQNALLPVLDLEKFPNATVDVFISLPQTDAGSRCAGICAASIALADAGIPMKDLVPAVSVGRVDDKVLADLCYEEEAWDGKVADVPLAMIPATGEFTLLQMDGEITPDQLKKALEVGKNGLLKIHEIQKAALQARYEGDQK